MTARDRESIASAPTEEEVMRRNDFGTRSSGVMVNAEPVTDPYTTGSNDHVPFAHATTTFEVQPSTMPTNRDSVATAVGSQSKPTAGVPTAYPTGAAPQHSQQQPPIAIATGAPIIRAAPSPVAPAPQRWNNASRDGQDCCNGRTCCCVTTITLTVVFICCVIPVIVVFVAVIGGINTIDSLSD